MSDGREANYLRHRIQPLKKRIANWKQNYEQCENRQRLNVKELLKNADTNF